MTTSCDIERINYKDLIGEITNLPVVLSQFGEKQYKARLECIMLLLQIKIKERELAECTCGAESCSDSDGVKIKYNILNTSGGRR